MVGKNMYKVPRGSQPLESQSANTQDIIQSISKAINQSISGGFRLQTSDWVDYCILKMWLNILKKSSSYKIELRFFGSTRCDLVFWRYIELQISYWVDYCCVGKLIRRLQFVRRQFLHIWLVSPRRRIRMSGSESRVGLVYCMYKNPLFVFIYNSLVEEILLYKTHMSSFVKGVGHFGSFLPRNKIVQWGDGLNELV